MNGAAKLLVVILCFGVCGAGVIRIPADTSRSENPKVNVTPVRNHENPKRIWIEV